MARPKLRKFAEFKTTIQDDTVEDDGDVLRYGGEYVAVALRELLSRPGRTVDTPYYADICGWRFYVRTRRRKLFFQVQFIGDYVLLGTDDDTLPEIFGKPKPTEFLEVLTSLNEDMRKDDRFFEIKWCTEDEIFDAGPGAPEPGPV
jgi:hypothetical protein